MKPQALVALVLPVILLGACASKQNPSASTPAKADEIQREGYKITKEPIKGPVVPVVPDQVERTNGQPPRQQSYDTPYDPEPHKKTIGKNDMKPVEAVPAPPKSTPVPTK